jgi:hypothetical protein
MARRSQLSLSRIVSAEAFSGTWKAVSSPGGADCGKAELFLPLRRNLKGMRFKDEILDVPSGGTALAAGGLDEERRLSERTTKKSEEEGRTRKELRAVARELTALRYRLLGVVASLAPREDEVTVEGDIDPRYDAVTEMRLAAQCVLRDNLEPAMASLRAAARFKPGEREEE